MLKLDHSNHLNLNNRRAGLATSSSLPSRVGELSSSQTSASASAALASTTKASATTSVTAYLRRTRRNTNTRRGRRARSIGGRREGSIGGRRGGVDRRASEPAANPNQGEPAGRSVARRAPLLYWFAERCARERFGDAPFARVRSARPSFPTSSLYSSNESVARGLGAASLERGTTRTSRAATPRPSSIRSEIPITSWRIVRSTTEVATKCQPEAFWS